MKRTLALFALLLAGLLLLAACGDDDDTPTPTSPSPEDTPTATATVPPPPPPSDPTVNEVSVGIGTGTVSGNVFLPQAITIPPGTTVTWTITSDEVHTITLMPLFNRPPNGPPPSRPENWGLNELVENCP